MLLSLNSTCSCGAGTQRVLWELVLSPFTVWVLGIELRSADPAAPLLCQALQLAFLLAFEIRSQAVAWTGLELTAILLPQFPQCWNCRVFCSFLFKNALTVLILHIADYYSGLCCVLDARLLMLFLGPIVIPWLG